MVGLVVIIAGILLALGGYLLVPDATKDANRQVLALKLLPPGATAELLYVRLNQPQPDDYASWWQGTSLAHRVIPVRSWHIAGDRLFYEEYTGMPDAGIPKQLSLMDVVYPMAADADCTADSCCAVLIDGSTLCTDLTSLQQAAAKAIQHETFLLGTDALGRDYLSRLLLGARVSLTAGFMAVLVSLAIGLLVGLLAGYFRGWVDRVVLYIINVFWSIPTLLLALSLSLVFSRGFSQVVLAIGLTMWIELARMVRGQVLGLREQEFIKAAETMGFRTWRILLRHLVPNLLGPVIVVVASNFAGAILLEAGLSFLGLGVERPTPSWGMMLSDNRSYLIAGLPHLAVLPGVAISLFVLAFFLVGNGLRDAFDNKSNRNQ